MPANLKEITDQTVYLTFDLDPSLEGVADFNKMVKKALASANLKFLILDFGQVRTANNEWLRGLTLLARELKEKNKGRLVAVNVQDRVKTAIKLRGLDSAIMLRTTIEEAMKDIEPGAVQAAGPSGPGLDVEFVNPFIAAAVEALKVQSNTNSSPGAPYLKNDESPKWDLIGIIGLSSTHFKGTIALCFTEKVYLAIMSQMLGEKVTVLTSDIADGAGELLNIIFGSAKTVLNEKDYGIDKAIPSVVTGENVKIKQLADRPTVVLPFKTEHGVYHIEIAIDQDSKKRLARAA